MKKIINNTINTKGAKMRKFILPILIAGAIAFTASQAMAAASLNIANPADWIGTHSLNEVGVDNHYTTSDNSENGGHIFGEEAPAFFTGLYGVSKGVMEGEVMGGYEFGANPFTASSGIFDTAAEGVPPLVAPGYTHPCPNLMAVCPANTDSTDPQTNLTNGTVVNEWEGVVLDDLYQTVSANDSTSTGPLEHGTTRVLGQTLDDLFFLGNSNAGTFYGARNGTIGPARVADFNIQDTLDQDLADYSISTTETMGVYGKLTQLFQLKGNVSSKAGCASEGGGDASMGFANSVDPCHSTTSGIGAYGRGGYDVNGVGYIDQWVVSDMWDWHGTTSVSDPFFTKDHGAERGVKQSYSSWFIIGQPDNVDYTYNYPGGHGAINKTVTLGTNHTHIDP